ncbi:MAG: hypothetical protein HC787_07820 [Nostocaceae cyanobacterium CSU_2_110]|nr:hypothetical protein [Nostocaceae cyanobacterium CSU_2_110]
MVDYEEDHLEYYLDSGTDELEISETESINIIPFDSQRGKLSKFSKFYQKKLSIWHSYQIKNNFHKLPEALKYLPIPTSTLPINFDQWQKSTKALSNVFFYLPRD